MIYNKTIFEKVENLTDHGSLADFRHFKNGGNRSHVHQMTMSTRIFLNHHGPNKHPKVVWSGNIDFPTGPCDRARTSITFRQVDLA